MREFILILVAAIISAFAGAGFGWLLALLSPEFIIRICYPLEPLMPERFAMAMGAVAGLFVGAGTMAFGLFVAALRNWANMRLPRE
jgi:hypothetical protein